MMALAIIICTWNRADSLRATLASLAGQSGIDSLEVIVVDNNSSDDTAAVVAEVAAAWPLGSLHYVFEGRQGKQFALNSGIRASTAQVLGFTDDDIIFPPDWASNIVAAFADPAIDVAGGRTLLTWPAGIPPWYDDSMAAILGGVDLGHTRLLSPPPGYAPAGANLVARRSVFERVGMFSEAHFRHMDYEFGQRCFHAGVAVAYEPSLLVWAPVDPAMLSRRYFKRWSFKAGIVHENDAPSDAALFLRVPRWVFRQLLTDVVKLPFDVVRGSAGARFARQLRIWRSAGTIASLWYVWLWPDKFPQWVAKYSQKRQNVY